MPCSYFWTIAQCSVSRLQGSGIRCLSRGYNEVYKYNQYNLDLIKAINADCDAIEDQNDCDEPDTIDTTPAIAKTVPLILTTTLQVILCQINKIKVI